MITEKSGQYYFGIYRLTNKKGNKEEQAGKESLHNKDLGNEYNYKPNKAVLYCMVSALMIS